MKIKLLFVSTMISIFGHIYSQCGSNIDFSSDWEKKGPSAAGNWIVEGGGSSVRQTINGHPTFYVSTENYIDVRINGTIRINSTSTDDDFVGFVFGYKNPVTPSDTARQDYYLFDWKRAVGANVGTHEGYALIKVDTSVVLTDTADMTGMYWRHNSYPGFDVLDTKYGTAYGWNYNTNYNFTLTYTSKQIIIEIGADTIFKQNGCYEPGRFGFYNLSQDQVIYSNFSYELIAEFDMSVSEACVGENVTFNSVNDACQSGSYISPITGWSWDFGDGTIINSANALHKFKKPGQYIVKLSVEDATDCISSVQDTIEVNGLVLDVSDDTLCKTETAIISATNIAGATYTWYKDGVIFPSVGTNVLNSLTPAQEGDFYATISGAVGYSCNTISDTLAIYNGTPPASIGSSMLTVCPGVPTSLDANILPGATYTWYLNGSLSSDATSNNGRTLHATQAGNYTVKVTASNGCDSTSGSVLLTAGSTPSVSFSADLTSICPYDQSILTVTTSESNIAWYRNNVLTSTLSGNQDTVNTAGDYKVVVTNEDGCTNTSNVVAISIKPLPNTTLTPSLPNLCPDVTSMDLTVSENNASQYTWASSDMQSFGNTKSITATGNNVKYWVIVTGQNGCIQSSDTFTVITNPMPDAAFTYPKTTLCENENVMLTASQASADRYRWYLNGVQFATSTSSNTTSFSATGEVSLKVEDGNCAATSDGIVFTELALPDATVTSSSNKYCTNDSIQLSVTFNSGAEYEWFNGNSPIISGTEMNTIYVNQTGTYKVVVTHSNGCNVVSSNIAVSEAATPVSLGTVFGATSYCPGDYNISYSINNVSDASYYLWTVSPETSASIGNGQGTNDIDLNFRNGSVVTITCTAYNQCGAGATSNQIASKSGLCFDPIQFSADKTNVCKGQSVTLTAHTTPGGFPPFQNTYRWEFTGTGAPSSKSGNSATVTFNTAGTFGVTLVEQADDGFGGKIDINSEDKLQYIHVGDGGTAESVIGENTVQCNQLYSYSVSPFTAGSSYSWSISNGQIISGSGTSRILVKFTTTGAGLVSVTETASSGCQIILNKNVQIDCSTDLIETVEATELTIYPNPTCDYIWLNIAQIESVINIKVFTQLGQPVIAVDNHFDNKLNVGDLKEGLYFGIVYMNDKAYVFRFVKE